MDLYQEYIHRSRYAKYKPETSGRETWEETVDRYCSFMFNRAESMGLNLDDSSLFGTSFKDTIKKYILDLQVMPSMRAMMTAGKALEDHNVAGYNCSFLPVDSLRSFDEIMYILMNGTGVGFSVEKSYVTKIPPIAETFHPTDSTIRVSDSKIGWASAFRELLALLHAGKIPKWDMSKIRSAGTPLKTFGGRASGPEPLESLFKFSVALFQRAAGRQLTSLEAHDLVCKVADIVVVGGVRRSALISLSDLEDNELRHAKSGQWWLTDGQRALANNSAVYKNSPDYGTFTEEWLALYRSKSGERGIFNRQAAINSMREYGRRDTDHQFGTNPCVVGSTRILTDKGYYPIEDLIGKQVNVWNGYEWSEVTPFATGKNKIVKVVLSDGTSLLTTYNHKFVLSGDTRVEAVDLQIGDKLEKYSMPVIEDGEFYPIDAYSQGFYSGDGCSGNTRSYLYSTKYSCASRLSGKVDLDTTKNRSVWHHGVMFDKNFVPVNGSLSYRLAWFAGLCDSDGNVVNNPNSTGLQLTSVDKDFLLNVKLMLTTMGVTAKVSQSYPERVKNINGTDYNCLPVYRLLVNASDLSNLIDLGLNLSRLIIDKSDPNRDARRFVVVTDLDFNMGEEETFCFTEPKNHTGTFEGIVTGQCGEILLRPYQFCNLSEVVIRPEDTLETLKSKTIVATFLGTIQSTFTDFTYLRSIWKKNCEEERLLGVSLTGIMDHPVTSGAKGFETLSTWLNELRELTIECNKVWASQLGINQSTAITCIKPSGCRPYDALTTTDKGILTLEEIFDISNHAVNEKWSTLTEDISAQQGSEASKITKTYVNGESPVYNIGLSYGVNLESTPNHMWFVSERRAESGFETVNDFVRTDQLKVGDVISTNVVSYKNTTPYKFKPFNKLSIHMSGQANDVIQPEFMTEDIAWLLGYLWGDGAMSPAKFRLRWVDSNVSNLTKAQRILKEVFNVNSDIKNASQNRKAYILEIGSKVLWHWLILNNVWKYTSNDSIDVIPVCVRSSAYTHVIAFIAGMLDADGWRGLDKNGKGKITFTTSSESFSKHFQHVAWSVGLGFGRSLNSKGKNLQTHKQMYLMALGGGHIDSNSVGVLVANSNKLTELSSRPEFNGWVCLNNSNKVLKVGEVFSVEVGGIKPTFDIETANHWYYAGAFKSHNTVSQLVNSSSGIHPAFSKHYIRTVRADVKDPLCNVLKDAGIPCEPDVTKPSSVLVFSFPRKAPNGAVVRSEISAIQQLELYSIYKKYWTEHNPSITVYVREHEWSEVGNWVYNNFNNVGGISFLPYSDHVYAQAPYQEITEDQYNQLIVNFPTAINWESLVENSDNTTGSQELACVAGSCEI